jgi:Importin beta binding domain
MEEEMKLLSFVDILHDAGTRLSRGVTENIRAQIQTLDVGSGVNIRQYVGDKLYGSPNPPTALSGIEDLFFSYCFDNQEIAQFFGIRANSDFSVLKYVPRITTVNEIQERRVCSITGTDNIKLVYRNLAEVLGLKTFTCDASPWMYEFLDPKGHRRTVGTLLDSSNGVSSRPGVLNVNNPNESLEMRNYLSRIRGVTMQIRTHLDSSDNFNFIINHQSEDMRGVTNGPSLNNILDNLNKGCIAKGSLNVAPPPFKKILVKTCLELGKKPKKYQIDILNRILLDLKTIGDAEQVNMSGGKIDVFITVDKLSAIRAALSGYFKLSIFTSNRNSALFFINSKAGLTPEQIKSNELKSTAKALFESCKKTADYYFNARSKINEFKKNFVSSVAHARSVLITSAISNEVQNVVVGIINKKTNYYTKVIELLEEVFPVNTLSLPSWSDRTDEDYETFIKSSNEFMKIMKPIRDKIHPYMQLFDNIEFENLFGFIDEGFILGINHIFTNTNPDIQFLKQADSSINEHVEIFDIYNFGIQYAEYISKHGTLVGARNYLDYGLNVDIEPTFEFRRNKITLGSREIRPTTGGVTLPRVRLPVKHKGIVVEEGRKKRAEKSVRLRVEKKDSALDRKRREMTDAEELEERMDEVTLLTEMEMAPIFQGALRELGLLFKFYAEKALDVLNYYDTGVPYNQTLLRTLTDQQLLSIPNVDKYTEYIEQQYETVSKDINALAEQILLTPASEAMDEDDIGHAPVPLFQWPPGGAPTGGQGRSTFKRKFKIKINRLKNTMSSIVNAKTTRRRRRR